MDLIRERQFTKMVKENVYREMRIDSKKFKSQSNVPTADKILYCYTSCYTVVYTDILYNENKCLILLFICHVVIQTDKTTRVCIYKNSNWKYLR